MLCPHCGDRDSRVTDSRDAGNEIRRRRECSICGVRFTTYERIQRALITVAKRDGRREDFDRTKLLHSIRLACVKRPLPTGTMEKLVEEIDSDVERIGRSEVPASRIGEITMTKLRELDRVAYIRYASVYRDFADLDEFQQEIQSFVASHEAGVQGRGSQLPLMPAEVGVPPKARTRRGRRPRATNPGEQSSFADKITEPND